MKKTLLFSLLVSSYLMAGNLSITQGNVEAHTEVFGDSNINPQTKNLISHLEMDNTIESIRGTIDISMRDLASDNSDRDENMAEAIDSTQYALATYTFKEVSKTDSGYKVNGILNFHGVENPLIINAQIEKTENGLKFEGVSSFLMSQYGVNPPKMFFLTVRDQIDLKINLMFENH